MRLLLLSAISIFSASAWAAGSPPAACPNYKTPRCAAGYSLGTTGSGLTAKFRCFKFVNAACPEGTTYMTDCSTWTSGVSHPANADGCKPSNAPGCSSVVACASGVRKIVAGIDSCEIEQQPTLGDPLVLEAVSATANSPIKTK